MGTELTVVALPIGMPEYEAQSTLERALARAEGDYVDAVRAIAEAEEPELAITQGLVSCHSIGVDMGPVVKALV